MGGAGKTQLVLEYCRRAKNSGTFRGIFWVEASSLAALRGSMKSIASKLLPSIGTEDAEAAANLVMDTLSSWDEAWLMVFDNLDKPANLNIAREHFPDSPHGSIIVTTRFAGSRELGSCIELGHMDEEECFQLLLHTVTPSAEEHAAASQIVLLLGYLPLAIDQARAYIQRRQLALCDFVNEYDRKKEEILKETPMLWPYRRKLPDSEKEAVLSVFTTWELSLSQLGSDGEQAEKLKDVLMLFSFFHHASISERVFQYSDSGHWTKGADIKEDSSFISENADNEDTSLPTHEGCFTESDDKEVITPMQMFHANGRWNHDAYANAIVQMRELSLLQFLWRGGGEIVVTLHSLVSEWLHMRLDSHSTFPLLQNTVNHLKSYLDLKKEFDLSMREEILSHLRITCKNSEFISNRRAFCGASFSFGVFYSACDQYGDSETCYMAALTCLEEKLGPHHTWTLNTFNNLGVLYEKQGRLADALRMYERALQGYKKAFGPNHISTLGTVNNLGALYKRQGRLADAERMYERALEGCEKTLNPIHLLTLKTINNLAVLYHDHGRLADAERMHKRALEGKEKALGPNHSSTLDTINNLGSLYGKQGRLADAERMYERALEGKEKVLGPNHTSTLDTIYNFGVHYGEQGRLADAERMYERALKGKEKALGPSHMSTLDTVNNLGVVYIEQDRRADAERMYERAMMGYEKSLGRNHTATLDTVVNLGNLYFKQGRLEDAERMYTRALNGREKALGPNHMSTLSIVYNLRILYTAYGRHEEAKRMFEWEEHAGRNRERTPRTS